MLPIARWIGYGGETNFHEGVLDPVALAAGLLARDRADLRLRHDPHRVQPPARRREADGDGRPDRPRPRGPEHRRGLEQAGVRRDGRRPARRTTTTATPTHRSGGRSSAGSGRSPAATTIDGRFWQLQGVESMPKPFDGLLPDPQRRLVDAGPRLRRPQLERRLHGGRRPGRRRRASSRPCRRTHATTYGREVGVFTPSYCVCRRDEGGGRGVPPLVRGRERRLGRRRQPDALQGLHAQSFSEEMLAMFRGRFAGGHGVCPLIGSPDDVAAEIKRFRDAGFGGMTLSFVDYVGELEYFAQEVLPRLEALGVRSPALSSTGTRRWVPPRPGRPRPSRARCSRLVPPGADQAATASAGPAGGQGSDSAGRRPPRRPRTISSSVRPSCTIRSTSARRWYASTGADRVRIAILSLRLQGRRQRRSPGIRARDLEAGIECRIEWPVPPA